MKSSILFSSIFRKRINFSIYFVQNKTFSTQGLCTEVKKSEDYFFSPKVQHILQKITGCDYEKVFKVHSTKLKPHTYKFVTDEELKKLQNIAASKARAKLQMPPVMDIREPINEVLSKDPEMQGYLRSTVVFTDISTSVTSRDRMITVREIDGTLRKANWEERHRMNQIFFPIPGRELEIPLLFQSPNLDNLLKQGSYEFVLDRACVQFEPDDPMYHKVTHATYEHIKNEKAFDVLRSTRHFGPMVFYFAQKKDIDQLLLDMIDRHLISDASDTIRLLEIINPGLVIDSSTKEKNELETVQDYIKSLGSQKGLLERSLQTYIEYQLKEESQEAAA